jgi:uncharacterized protein YndB with AHSA1/START domain
LKQLDLNSRLTALCATGQRGMGMVEEQETVTVAPGHWLDLRRRLAAPWQVVFRQWIEPSEVAAWFGPMGYSVTAHLIEPEPGGSWRVTLRSPAGEDFVVVGRYLEVDPPGRLRLTWIPETGQGRGAETEVELTLRPHQGATWLRLRHGPFASPELVASHARAWGSALDSLALKLDEESR